MTNVLNGLPIAVHVASGGDARVRTGGTVIPLNGISSGNFQVTNGGRYRLVPSLRASVSAMVLVGYESPLSTANGALVGKDLSEVVDDVPAGTTVHFSLFDPSDLSAVEGTEFDFLYVTFYD